jgi:S-adenosylmethionine:tRNA ribosyltransferase-isomerase
MKTNLFDYHLPRELIAQSPMTPRDHSRLLVYDRKAKKITHDHFYNLVRCLKPTDVLVFNDTKVFPARLFGRKETVPRQARKTFGGGKIEVFLLRSVAGDTWEVLMGGKVRRVGQKIHFTKSLQCEVVKKLPDGIWHVRFNKTPKQVLLIANKIGATPTPPYIKKIVRLKDYQTIYAKKVGSVAAPTAGFHFTKRLLAQLKKKGVQFEYVTLHVGFGTFQPVKVNDIRQHKIHSEYAEIDSTTAKRLVQAKKDGRRIIAVGTTTVRTLETAFDKFTGSRRALAGRRQKVGASPPALLCNAKRAGAPTYPRGFRGWISTFIYPGYKFKFVDAIITNFHLPKSSLLMLVSAFVGRKHTLDIYKKAIKKTYRFYSFGDGMFIE